jgi:release factor glutamine methyltransferase
MTVKEAMNYGSRLLGNSGLETPALDSSLLLSSVLGWPKEKLYISGGEEVPEGEMTRYRGLLEKRTDGYAVAYLTGEKEFYGRTFAVGEGALCPRPDTEILVEETLSLCGRLPVRTVLDLCTGTGCIALTLAAEMPDLDITASDVSPDAEKWFRRNSASLPAEVRFVRSDLFSGISGRFDMIVSNPPYLTDRETETRLEAGWKEPSLALAGGPDGLDILTKIVMLSRDYLNDPGYLLLEADPRQMERISEIMSGSGFTGIRTVRDLAGDDRVIIGSAGCAGEQDKDGNG